MTVNPFFFNLLEGSVVTSTSNTSTDHEALTSLGSCVEQSPQLVSESDEQLTLESTADATILENHTTLDQLVQLYRTKRVDTIQTGLGKPDEIRPIKNCVEKNHVSEEMNAPDKDVCLAMLCSIKCINEVTPNKSELRETSTRIEQTVDLCNKNDTSNQATLESTI